MAVFLVWVVILFIVPTFSCLIVAPCYCTTKDRKKALIYSAFLAIFFSIVGYCYKNPKTDPDIVRYIQMLQQYRGKGFIESFNLVYDNLYSVDIWFYVLSRFKDDQLLPAITMFVFYLIIFYILSDYRIRKNIPNKYFIVYIIFSILSINLGCVLNAFRSSIAFVVFFFAFYREIVQKKRNIWTYILYIFSFFMHFTVIALIALRIALIIKNKKLLVSASSLVIFVPKILEIIGSRTLRLSTGSAVLNHIIYFINRANMYFRWSDGGWAETVSKSGYYRVERIYYLLIMSFFIYVGIYHFKKKHKVESFRISISGISTLEQYQVFGIMYMAITMMTFFITVPEYNRFITPFIPFAGIIFFDYWSDKSINKKGGGYVLPLIMLGGFGIVTNIYFMNTLMSLIDYFVNILTFCPLLGGFLR